MISLDQIKALETKVHSAVDEITRLRRENQTITDALTMSEQRLRELEGLVGDFKNEQAEIEATIVRTLHNLDQLEDGLAGEAEPPTAPAGELEAAHAPAAARQTTAAGNAENGQEVKDGDGGSGDDQELEIS